MFLLTSVTAPASAAPQAAERWALVVGIGDYAGRTVDTHGGLGDARDLRRALLESGWPASHIVELTERHATAAAIREGLEWLARRSSPDSFSVFHFSGHVKQLRGDRDGDGEQLDEYLWAADNRFIVDRELTQRLRSVRGRVWVDIAGCEAAGFDDGLSGPRHLFTASSREQEKSYEVPEWRNSVFTGLLVDQGMLRRSAAGEDGRVSIQDAFRFAAERAPKMTARQRTGPQHPVLRGGGGAEWFLGDPPPAPAKPQGQREQRRCFLAACFGRSSETSRR